MELPRWRQSLARSLQDQHGKAESRFFQAASVLGSSANAPDNDLVIENRTLVFRGFADNNNDILAVTDSRSEKIAQWKEHPQTQICWYFSKSREQYRISATVILLDGQHLLSAQEAVDDISVYAKLRHKIWNELSDKAKQQFLWPRPKLPVQEANKGLEYKGNIDDLSGIPRNFTLICFVAHYVDYLNLRTEPQLREIHENHQGIWDYKTVNA